MLEVQIAVVVVVVDLYLLYYYYYYYEYQEMNQMLFVDFHIFDVNKLKISKNYYY
jgi:hypothetical protein